MPCSSQANFGGNFGLGNWWYASTLVSPIAGKYYLDNAERTDQVTVKIVTEDDESISDVIVQAAEAKAAEAKAAEDRTMAAKRTATQHGSRKEVVLLGWRPLTHPPHRPKLPRHSLLQPTHVRPELLPSHDHCGRSAAHP